MSALSHEAIRRAEEQYHPCSCGVHICGIRDDGFVTVENFETATDADALALFEALKAECEADDEYDVVVDLMQQDRSHIADFCMTRQMLDRCRVIARDLRASLTKEDSRG